MAHEVTQEEIQMIEEMVARARVDRRDGSTRPRCC